MATDVKSEFQNPDFRPAPQPPDFHPELTESPHDGLHFWQFMVAGSVAGCVEHMAMFPVDTVKTHMQALGSCPIKSVSVRQALQSILKTEGPSALYRGIGAMGLGAGPAHAVYFSVYEMCKKYFSHGDPKNSTAHAISGVCATVTSDAVLTPMDMVKQRLQLSNSGYKGVGDCVKRVFSEEGLGAFYASYRTTVLMNAPYTAVHFATYEAAKRGLMEISPQSADDERLLVHATAGAAAGALAAAVTTPLDVVKTQLQCQGVCGCDRFKSGSIGDVIKTIVKKDGYRGLMRGWIPRMLFHAPAAAICWSTYEAGKTFFQGFNQRQDSHTVN
ncbi:mitoferrin-like [Senna tora]|uniref:Mitoferrin-like n=1 Tax=Senna tora TaxID=362788 RepID=A0A834WGF7_9FABA|nr:mitoferrin-like [Senna tora]